ncbi:ribosomal RNA-processing protein 8 isoform X2 [Capsicum annuum]|uniref:ribosomal RNA-processing protein 8 isoform X2 n=1 Tax=Capsicum annuum TaxID=4072 RepID=UPI0007BEECC3|nr:ribosomal RNA-processing protein 8 isoform X2 [Capsicum annuum]
MRAPRLNTRATCHLPQATGTRPHPWVQLIELDCKRVGGEKKLGPEIVEQAENKYHAGYQEQMLHWPEQPVNIITKWLKDHSPSLVVADFGCGDARLARSVKNKVWSLDLVANDPSVIACDMSNTPLESSSVDVAVFCLSLMGTNYSSFLREALRVLKPRGWLLIAEVKSRLDPNTGGADPNKFLKAICELGFTMESKDFSNKMFVLFYLKKKEKQNSVNKDINWPELKPCIYKRR